jgi:membrane protease YdiL (CAAX protease family)
MNVRIEEPDNATSRPAPVRLRAEWVTALIWLLFAVAVFWARAGGRANASVTVAAFLLFVLLTGATLCLSVTSCRERLRALPAGPIVQLLGVPVAIVVAIVIYAVVAGLPLAPRAAAYGAYLVAPTLVAGARIRSSPSPLQVLAAALCLWLPLEFHLLPTVALPPASGLRAAEFAALTTGLYLFLVARPVDRIGYTFLLAGRDVLLALVATAAFAVLAIPIGIGTHFLAWHPRVNVASTAIVPFAIYIATALPEEFLFRGLIQNSLERVLGRTGLPIAAIVFGLAHLPDPRYVVLATLAGLAYGWVYLRTRRITASAITHAVVDWIWVLLLRVR